VEYKNKSDTNNNKGNWNHLEQYTREARNQRNTENSHIGHCTHTSEVVMQKYKIQQENNIIRAMNSSY
jgi:hypothetical protein